MEYPSTGSGNIYGELVEPTIIHQTHFVPLAHHGVLQALRGSPIDATHIVAHLVGAKQFGFVAPPTLASRSHGR